jgi:2-hydroxy-6-oxonona-2,4-dienedioate hydrolase
MLWIIIVEMSKNIIILHGWGHSASLWLNFQSQLNNLGYNVIVEDLPGFGSRVNEAFEYGVGDYANWFTKEFDSLISEQKITIIGHSLGGRIGIELAQHNPAWLEQLILIGTPGIYEPNAKTKLIKKLSFLKQIPGLSKLAFSVNSEYELAKTANLKETYQNVVSHNQKNILHKITIPTTLIWGSQDTTVPVGIANQIKQLIVGSKLILIPNSGHSPHLNNPNLLYGILKKVLEK